MSETESDKVCSSEKTIKNGHGCSFALVVVVCFVVLICAPLIIEWIALNGLFSCKPVTTTLTPNEWVAFWGSYLGAIGTVLLGAIAYRQNKSLAKANERLSKIQELYFENLSQPILQMGTHLDTALKNPIDVQQDETQYIIYFSDLNADGITKENINEFRALTMKFPIENLSRIPLMYFKVISFCWTISGKAYVFNCNLQERKTRIMYCNSKQIFNMTLIYPALITSNPTLKDCAQAIANFSPDRKQSNHHITNKIVMEVWAENQANISRALSFEFELSSLGQNSFWITESTVYTKEK